MALIQDLCVIYMKVRWEHDEVNSFYIEYLKAMVFYAFLEAAAALCYLLFDCFIVR